MSPSFDIVPAWLKPKVHSKTRETIYIDTSFAFGTGEHPTTRFMAGLIDWCRGKFDSFLDIDTGTGILAIVAQKCGATQVTALDISEDAVVTAKSNLKLNQV